MKHDRFPPDIPDVFEEPRDEFRRDIFWMAVGFCVAFWVCVGIAVVNNWQDILEWVR